jgi:hypothetical protein
MQVIILSGKLSPKLSRKLSGSRLLVAQQVEHMVISAASSPSDISTLPEPKLSLMSN